jgi:hypothetical protein
MSHADKLAQAIALIGKHNEQLDEAERISVPKFEAALKKAGGTTEDTLRECTWEDLEDCGLPKILARKIAQLFRAASEVSSDTDSKYVSARKAEKMHPLYLLQNLELTDPDSAVAKRLKDLSKGKRFLVVKPDGSVDADASLQELQLLQRGYNERERIMVNNVPVELRTIGYRPASQADENPIYRGLALRPDGMCDQTNRSWSQVPLVVRQLVYVALHDTRELRVGTIDEAHNIIDRSIAPDAIVTLRNRYPKASIRLDELEQSGNAPRLKVSIGGSATNAKQDPFYQPPSAHRVH